MLSTFSISIIILGSYLFILTILAVRAYISQDHNGYVIGERNLGLFTTVCSMLAGQFNGGGVFFTFTLGLMLGFGQLWTGFGFLLGYIVLSFFAKTVNEESKTHNDINVPDLLNRRIGIYTQHFSSFIIIGKACLFGTAQLLIAGTIISTLFNLPNAWGVCITATIIGIYVYMGGYLTVVKTDILQWGILFLISLCAFLFFPIPDISQIANEVITAKSLTKWELSLFTFMLILSNADAWQRTMSVKTGNIAQQALLISGILFVVFIFAMTIIVTSWGITKGTGFFELFENNLLSPTVLAILGTFTLIAIMSTIDTQVQLFSSALSKNVLKINLNKNKEQFISVSRTATIILLTGISLLASTLGSTTEFILKAFSFAYVLAPIMITAMIWGKEGSKFKDYICIIALTSGLCVYTFMFFNGYFSSIINNIIPASITTIICFIGITGNYLYKRVKLLRLYLKAKSLI